MQGSWLGEGAEPQLPVRAGESSPRVMLRDNGSRIKPPHGTLQDPGDSEITESHPGPLFLLENVFSAAEVDSKA